MASKRAGWQAGTTRLGGKDVADRTITTRVALNHLKQEVKTQDVTLENNLVEASSTFGSITWMASTRASRQAKPRRGAKGGTIATRASLNHLLQEVNTMQENILEACLPAYCLLACLLDCLFASLLACACLLACVKGNRHAKSLEGIRKDMVKIMAGLFDMAWKVDSSRKAFAGKLDAMGMEVVQLRRQVASLSRQRCAMKATTAAPKAKAMKATAKIQATKAAMKATTAAPKLERMTPPKFLRNIDIPALNAMKAKAKIAKK